MNRKIKRISQVRSRVSGRRTTGLETTPISNLYFNWLCLRIGTSKGPYVKLCAILYQTNFTYNISNDENREADGYALREEFVDYEDYDETHLEVKSFMAAPVNLLEVLIALADRMNGQMESGPYEDIHSSKWFNVLLKNLGLDIFTDSRTRDIYLSPNDEREIERIIKTMLDRTYDINGVGGLFPLKIRPRKDMRDVEIWYQMMAWLDENYD